MRSSFGRAIVLLLCLCGVWTPAFCQTAPSVAKPDFLPVSAQFSPIPSGKGWNGHSGPISPQELRDTVDNIAAHGFTGIQSPTGLPKPEEDIVLQYAQSRGMIVTQEIPGGLEGFGREAPPSPCVYSPDYAKGVRARAQQALTPLAAIPRLYNVICYQDEPFHAGEKSFGYNAEVKAEFKKRYGYDLPADLNSIRNDPRRWRDVINFRADYFRDAWRQVYKAVKEVNPNFKVVLTHDSHNTFGGGCGSNAEIAVDDVFHWGGDFADTFIFDIYPYMMFDFRFGEPGRLPKPRISQAHYSFAQMRNLARAYDKEMGFWVGTYNPAWFGPFLNDERKNAYWSEREMSTTAVAQGANFLLTGFKIPTDSRHWDAFGEGLRLIQRAGGKLLDMPKLKARACMLFPRTQMIQTQQEYFNAGLSYELFLRAFGELDILHEEQVTDEKLDGYGVLVLFDVGLLPADVAKRIATFVQNGGVVIADAAPRLNEFKEPMTVMQELFGVKDAKTDRVRRTGHFVKMGNGQSVWHFRPEGSPDESNPPTDKVQGAALGQPLDLTVVSPRPATVTSGEVLLKTAAGNAAIVTRSAGKGRVFLLGFCLQDTYFKTWQDDRPAARDQLAGLLKAMTQTAGVRARVRSSNPDIEASVRAGKTEGFLFVINHEATTPAAEISLCDLGFELGGIVDLADGKPVAFEMKQGAAVLNVAAKVGQTRLLRLTSK